MSVTFYKSIDGRPVSFGDGSDERFICDIFINDFYEEENQLDEIIFALINNRSLNVCGETSRLRVFNEFCTIEDLEEVETQSGLSRLILDNDYLVELLSDWKSFVFGVGDTNDRVLNVDVCFYQDHFDSYRVASKFDCHFVASILEADHSIDNSKLNKLLSRYICDIEFSGSVVFHDVSLDLSNRPEANITNLSYPDLPIQKADTKHLEKVIRDWSQFKLMRQN